MKLERTQESSFPTLCLATNTQHPTVVLMEEEAAAYVQKQHKPEQKLQEYRLPHLKKKQEQRLKNRRKTI